MPFHRVSDHVDATVETVWAVLLDKMEHPQRYIDDALGAEVLERRPAGVVRRMMLPGGVVFRESVTADPGTRTITFTLLDHPVYEGTVLNRLREGMEGGVDLVFELDWTARPGRSDDRASDELPALIRSSVARTKRIAEVLENGS